MNIFEQERANKRASWIVVGIVVLFFVFIGFGFDYFYGAGLQFPAFTGIAILFGVGTSYLSFAYGDRMIIASTHARPLDTQDPQQQQWQNIIEEMSIAAGIPVPKTYVIEDPDPNAFATGQDPQHSSIVVTRGLLNALNRDELQGVAAHEMSHIKNFDIRLMLILAVFVGAIALLADWAARSLWFGRGRSNRRSEGSGAIALFFLVLWLIGIILAPIFSQIMAMAVSRKRESLADASGAALTRNPLGLASALEKISSHTSPTRSINQGTAHLCIADPKGTAVGVREDWVGNLFATHPPISKRIAALKEMAYQYNASYA